MNCDTCFAEADKLWVFPHREFSVAIVVQPQPLIQNFELGDWGCCDECAALMLKKDVEGMTQRAMLNPNLTNNHEFFLGLFRQTYAMLFTRLTGSGPKLRTKAEARRRFTGEEIDR